MTERRDDCLFGGWLRFQRTSAIQPERLASAYVPKTHAGEPFTPGLIEDAYDLKSRSYLVRYNCMFGSQALLVSRKAALFVVEHWNEIKGMPDIKMLRLVGRLK